VKSQGTKETQGINGDAAALGRREDAALAALGDVELKPCAYERHRGLGLDYDNDGGLTICGCCHPRSTEAARQRAAGPRPTRSKAAA
jgi:hypothetical protein